MVDVAAHVGRRLRVRVAERLLDPGHVLLGPGRELVVDRAEELGRALLSPDVQLFEVESGGPYEDASCQVVDARLQDAQRVFGHVSLPIGECSTSLDLYSLRRRLPHGTRSTRVCTTRTLRSLSRIDSASEASARSSGASSTSTGSGGSCFTPGASGLTRT